MSPQKKTHNENDDDLKCQFKTKTHNKYKVITNKSHINVDVPISQSFIRISMI